MVMSLVGAEGLGASIQMLPSEKRIGDPNIGNGPRSPLDERHLATRVVGLGLRPIGDATSSVAMLNVCRLTDLFWQYAYEVYPEDAHLVTLSPMATRGLCVHDCSCLCMYSCPNPA